VTVATIPRVARALTDHHKGQMHEIPPPRPNGNRGQPSLPGNDDVRCLGQPDHDDSIRIIHKALDAGVNFVDTADVYAHGESEQIVGKALKGRRDVAVLASKLHYPMGDDPNHQGNSRRWITAAVESSRRRVHTNHPRPLLGPPPRSEVDVEKTLSALYDLHSGQARAIGASTFPASEIVAARWVAERRGLERLRTEQPTYSIVNRSIKPTAMGARRAWQFGWATTARRAANCRSGRKGPSQRGDPFRRDRAAPTAALEPVIGSGASPALIPRRASRA
jgi:aryl-alcohol dehydrogenase-like predicted oxidoreductase